MFIIIIDFTIDPIPYKTEINPDIILGGGFPFQVGTGQAPGPDPGGPGIIRSPVSSKVIIIAYPGVSYNSLAAP